MASNFSFLRIILIFAQILCIIRSSGSDHQIYTTGNPYELGVSLLGMKFFDYSFKPMKIDNVLTEYEGYTHVSVSSQKVVLYTNRSRILLFGSNQNFPIFDNPATIIDSAQEPSIKLSLNETISRVVNMNMYVLAIGKTKIQYFGELTLKWGKVRILDIPPQCRDFVLLPNKGNEGYLFLAKNNVLCAVFRNGYNSLMPHQGITEQVVVEELDTSNWLPKGSNIIHIASRRNAFLILTDKYEVFTWGVESLARKAFLNEWNHIEGDVSSNVEAIFPTEAKGLRGRFPIDIIGGVDGVIVRVLGISKNRNYLYTRTDEYELPEDPNFMQMEVGDRHVIILKKEDPYNAVYVYGDNTYGELGIGKEIKYVNFNGTVKMNINPTGNLTYIAADCHFSLVLEEMTPHLACNGKYFSDLNVCSGHGKCFETKTCKCFAGYYGEDCEKEYQCFGENNRNSQDVCSGHGVCAGNDKCDCFPGYTGEKCQNWTCHTLNASDPNVCNGHGICTKFDNCVCDKFTKINENGVAEEDEYFGLECSILKSQATDEIYYYQRNANGTVGPLIPLNTAKYFWRDEKIKKVVGNDTHLHILTTKDRLFFWGKDCDFDSGMGIRNFEAKNHPLEVPFFRQLRKMENDWVFDVSSGDGFTIITTYFGVYLTGMMSEWGNDGFKFPKLVMNCTRCPAYSDFASGYVIKSYPKITDALQGIGWSAKARIGEFEVNVTSLMKVTHDFQSVSLGTRFISGCGLAKSFIGVTDTGMLYGEVYKDIRVTKPVFFTSKSFIAATIPTLFSNYLNPFGWGAAFRGSDFFNTVYPPISSYFVNNSIFDPVIGDVVQVHCGPNFGAFQTKNGSWYGFGDNAHNALGVSDTRRNEFCFVESWSPEIDKFGKIDSLSFGEEHSLFKLADGRIIAAGLHNFSFPLCNENSCHIPIQRDISQIFPKRANKVSNLLATKTQSFFIVSSMESPKKCDGAPYLSQVSCNGRGYCGEDGVCHCQELSFLKDFGVSKFYKLFPSIFPNDKCQLNEGWTFFTLVADTAVLIFIPTVVICTIFVVVCCALCGCGGLCGVCGIPISTSFGTYFCCRKRLIKNFKEKQQYELTQALLKTKAFDLDETGGNSPNDDPENSVFSLDKSLFSINYDDLKDLKELDEQGGSGCLVFKASWKGETVFVKLFKILNRQDSKYDLTEFKREVQLMASLNHSSIVSFFGVFLVPPKRVGYVTEFCTHGNLYSIIGQNFSLRKRLQYLIQIAKGMRYLHEKGVIFRDLKCQNVLLDENYNVKLTDFGISRLSKNGSGSGSGGSTYTKSVGTSQYMAPEIVRGEKYNEKVDVYSFSILMYEVYYDTKTPFGKDVPFNVEYKVAQDPSFRPKLSEDCPKSTIAVRLGAQVTSPVDDAADAPNHLTAQGAQASAAGILAGEEINTSNAKETHKIGEACRVHDEINKLIQECWDNDPEKRPTFQEIVEKLSCIFVDLAM